MLATQDLIYQCKKIIETSQIDTFQEFVRGMLEYDYDWPYVFHRVYLHACLKKKKEIAEWLQTALYPFMDPIQQIALRQIFVYGRHLLSK